MTKDPSFPWYASDWLGSNKRALMSLEQQGAYMNLLCRQWTDPDCSLPDDDEELAVLSGMNQGWFKGGCQMVRKCFPPHPDQKGRIANERLLEIRSERDAWVEKSRQGGLKSAMNKKLRKVKGGSTTVGTNRQPKSNSPSPSSSPSPSPIKEPPKAPQGAVCKKRFTKPLLAEVAAYCEDRGKGIDAREWMDHYEANGWKVGRNPMKDWKASVRTWERNGGFGNSKQPRDDGQSFIAEVLRKDETE